MSEMKDFVSLNVAIKNLAVLRMSCKFGFTSYPHFQYQKEKQDLAKTVMLFYERKTLLGLLVYLLFGTEQV